MTRAAWHQVRRLQLMATVVAVATALAALPTEHLPLLWIAAGIVPAATLALIGVGSRGFLGRVALGIALQIGMAWSAYRLAGELSQPAALAATLLPPLAFVTVRGRSSELVLAQFLSFCMLLIGAILDRPALPYFAVFVVSSTVALRCLSRLHALRDCSAMPAAGIRSPRLLGGALALSMSFLVCALAVDRAMHLLPTPRSQVATRTAANRPQVRTPGLSDTFDLEGGGFLDLRSDRLVRVMSADKENVPADLYLRSGFFQEASTDEWRVGPLSIRVFGAVDRELPLGPVLPGTRLRRLEIQCEAATRDLLFVPPGAVSLLGIPAVSVDLDRGWLRRGRGAPSDVYEVAYHDAPVRARGRGVDPRWNHPSLLQLPADLDRRRLLALLEEWHPGDRASPMEIAEAIAAGLQRRCTYARQEPRGPHGTPVSNFLFGSQTGYCMHFANAAALLLRMAGVPCRIGVGLQGGVAEAGSAARIFGGGHAHAWVEIPLQDLGWVVMDPTPPSDRGGRSLPQQPPEAAAGGDDTGGDGTPDLATRLWNLLASPWPAAIAILLLLAVPMFMPSRVRRAVVTTPLQARPARKRLLRILRELEKRGVPRRGGQTLENYLEVLGQREAAAPDLVSAFAAYQEVRFGNRPFDHDRQARLDAGLAAAQLLVPLTDQPTA